MVIFVRADAWPDEPRHYTARITSVFPEFPDAVGQMTCVIRDPYKWGIFPRKIWGKYGLREMIEDLARIAGPIQDHDRVSVHITWHQKDPQEEE